MRTSQPTSGFRPLRAGVAVAVTTAAVLSGLATPAFAANTAVVATPNTGPVGGGNTVALAGTGAFPSASAAVLAARTVSSSASCPTTYGTSGTTAAATRVDDDNATVVLPALAAGTFKVCVYGVASGSVASASPLVATSDAITISVANTKPVLSSTSGAVAGGNTITATGTGTYLSTVSGTSVGATFSAGACPSTYSTATGNFAATGAKTSTSVATITVPGTLTAGTSYNVCIYAGTLATSALLGSGSAQYTALPSATISPKAGSSGVASTLTITAPTTSTFAASPSPLPGVTLTTDPCPSTYTTATTRYVGPFAGTVIRINGGKIAVTLPATKIETGVGQATTAWNVCTYANATTGALILAPATYTVAPALTVSNVVAPTGGPAQGGTTVTITGTGFPYPKGDNLLTASIGGVALTDVTSTSATTLTGKTGAHAAGTVDVSVTTAAGTETSVGGTPFTYSYGISISPNSAAPSATGVTLDIQGAGFGPLEFEDYPASGTVDDTKAHVLLVDNSWFANNTDDPDEAYSDGGVVTECIGVIKIGGDELLCTLDLTQTVDTGGLYGPGVAKPGAYQVVVVNASTGLDSATHSNVSSGSTFTIATY
jgi:IPT/TIG domain-containing protein